MYYVKKCEWTSECIHCNDGRMHAIWINAPQWCAWKKDVLTRGSLAWFLLKKNDCQRSGGGCGNGGWSRGWGRREEEDQNTREFKTKRFSPRKTWQNNMQTFCRSCLCQLQRDRWQNARWKVLYFFMLKNSLPVDCHRQDLPKICMSACFCHRLTEKRPVFEKFGKAVVSSFFLYIVFFKHVLYFTEVKVCYAFKAIRYPIRHVCVTPFNFASL